MAATEGARQARKARLQWFLMDYCVNERFLACGACLGLGLRGVNVWFIWVLEGWGK